MSLLNDLTVLLECQAHDEVRALFRRQLELLEHAASEADRLGDELAGAEDRIDDLTAELDELSDLKNRMGWLLPLAVDSILEIDSSELVPNVLTDEQRAGLRSLPDWADHLSFENYRTALSELAADILAGEYGELPGAEAEAPPLDAAQGEGRSWYYPEGWVDSAPGNETAFEAIVDECGEVPSGTPSREDVIGAVLDAKAQAATAGTFTIEQKYDQLVEMLEAEQDYIRHLEALPRLEVPERRVAGPVNPELRESAGRMDALLSDLLDSNKALETQRDELLPFARAAAEEMGRLGPLTLDTGSCPELGITHEDAVRMSARIEAGEFGEVAA